MFSQSRYICLQSLIHEMPTLHRQQHQFLTAGELFLKQINCHERENSFEFQPNYVSHEKSENS